MSADELIKRHTVSRVPFAAGGGKAAAKEGMRNVQRAGVSTAQVRRIAKAERGVAAGKRSATLARALEPLARLQGAFGRKARKR